MTDVRGSGTREDPWQLRTPPGTSEYTLYRDEAADPPALVCQVGSTKLTYRLRCIEDLHGMLKEHGDWMPLGAADEQKPAPDGSVEAWGRSADNPVGDWYGLRKGLPRPVRDVRAAAPRGSRARRAHPRAAQQPGARDRGGVGSQRVAGSPPVRRGAAASRATSPARAGDAGATPVRRGSRPRPAPGGTGRTASTR